MTKVSVTAWLMVLLAASNPLPAADTLSLAEATAKALDHSFIVKAARHDSTAAALRYDASRTLRFPTLSLEAKSYFVDDLQSFELPVPSPTSRRLEIGAKENYQADFTLSIPLYTGGKLSRRIDIARETSRAESSRLEAERMTVAYRCRQAYLNLLLAESSVEIARASTERVKIIRTDVQNLYDNGLADSVDILEAESAGELARETLSGRLTGYGNAQATLARLIGPEADADIHLSDIITEPPEPVHPDPAPPEITRAELERFTHVIKAAEDAARLAQADYFPTLNAFGGYSVGRPNRDMFDREWDDYFRVGLLLNWQFNLGGQTGKNRAAAGQTARSSRMARRALEDDLKLQYEIAANNLDHAYRVIGIFETEFLLAQRKFDLARQRQREGQLSVNRLLEMEEDLTAAELRHQASLILYYLAETDYLYAVGSPKVFGGLR